MMIVKVGDIRFTVAVHEEHGRHVAAWTCGACRLSGRTAAVSVAAALNGAKASMLIHHTMDHGITFTGEV